MNDTQQLPISIQPIINYPRAAEVGKKYLMEIDIKQTGDFEKWNYEEEEYPIYCRVDTYCEGDNTPLFKIKTIGEPAVVLHRFGGTYGAAKFLLTAAQKEMKGEIRVTLVNGWGVHLKTLCLEDVAVVTEKQSVVAASAFKVTLKSTPSLQSFEFETEVATNPVKKNAETVVAVGMNTETLVAVKINHDRINTEPLAAVEINTETLAAVVLQELQTAAKTKPAKAQTVAMRIAQEVERICLKSNRI
ncbi:MAG: hypothetical protein F6K22_03290, partial [Okeania sp. SIO2F4]|nr:hypothetical protein [Okeania sp. SIO2F4]